MSDILLNAEEKMMGVIENLESNLRQIRTGRASGQMLERVQVEYYGAMTPINQMAQISVVEGTQLVIKPYDRSIIKDIAHAIQAANLGLNPQAEADVIRIQVPQLTEDRRKELAKDAQKYGEEAKLRFVTYVVMQMMQLRKIKNSRRRTKTNIRRITKINRQIH